MSVDTSLDYWAQVELGDIAEFVMGQAPKKSECNYRGEGAVFVKAGEFSVIKPVIKEWTTNPLKRASENDVLICVVGATAGKLNLGIDCAIGRSVAAIRPVGGVQNVFIYQYLRTQVTSLRKGSTGSAQGVISKTDLHGVAIPFPPLAEQKVIADKLDILLAQVENTKVRLERIPQILKRFRQSVLAAAVSGRLTEEWRQRSEIVEKISHERVSQVRKSAWEQGELARLISHDKAPKNQKWKLKYKEPEGVLCEDCFDIPDTWCWSNLGELTWSIKDGPHFSPNYVESGVPFISGRNISPEGINFDGCKYITEQLHEELSKRCKPEIGDVLYTKGGTTGIACLNQECRDFNVWVHVAVLKLTSVIDGKYLQHVLNSEHCYRQSQRYTHGVGNQDLGLTRMTRITVPVPSFEEQTEIVRRVDQLFAHADRTEQQVNKALARVNNLTQSILAKAFRGELTEQWRKDNPELISGENSAKSLLERIKAERAAQKPAGRQSKKKKSEMPAT